MIVFVELLVIVTSNCFLIVRFTFVRSTDSIFDLGNLEYNDSLLKPLPLEATFEFLFLQYQSQLQTDLK